MYIIQLRENILVYSVFEIHGKCTLILYSLIYQAQSTGQPEQATFIINYMYDENIS